jgi:hypothetical protein
MANNQTTEDKFSLSKLKEWYSVGRAEYTVAHRRAVKLDAADRGKLWEAIEARFPAYQILPDSNWVSYIKQNILASIYTVGKSARLIPTSEDDKEIVEQLNIALDHIWSTLNVGQYQMEAGERAALLNYGVTQVGWDNSVCAGLGDAFHKGDVILKNINPLRFMRDPFAIDLDHAAWCVTWDSFHKSVIKDNPRYKEKFEEWLSKSGSADTSSQVTFYTDKVSRDNTNKKDYYTVYTWYVNDNGKVHEIHTLNNECVLYRKDDIKPACFPFAELYCNLPAGDLFGTSECAKVFSNNVAYNLLNSIMLTSEYKNQRPPRFINGQSGINVPAFVKHGNDADRTFVVQGDASKAVHYQQYPQPSAQSIGSMQQLGADIKNVSGVDERYTGRDTGSILTTGGIENMMDQVTMIDAAKINNYEAYAARLTKLVISNYIQFSRKRKYFHKNPTTNKWKTIEVDFPKVDTATIFDYQIAISTELPKSKARVEAVADHLMEMQMQYQGQGVDVDIITPEEWLMMKDLPMREYMQERMGIQRTQNWVSMVSQAVTEYGSLVANGVAPDDAIAATADTMGRMSQPGAENAIADQMGSMQDMGMMPNGNTIPAPMPGM